LPGFGRAAAFNGLGRSLWFFWMDRPHEGLEFALSCGADSEAIVGGMGLAAAFTFPDDLSRAYSVADSLRPEVRRHFRKGIRIALYVRQRNDSDHLDECLAGLPPSLAGRAREDLDRALQVGEATEASENFIELFHSGCTPEPS
jgi:hypothetical protein